MTDNSLIHEARFLSEGEWKSWWPKRAQRALKAAADALEAVTAPVADDREVEAAAVSIRADIDVCGDDRGCECEDSISTSRVIARNALNAARAVRRPEPVTPSSAADIAQSVRRSCTPPSDLASPSSDRLIAFVADWIEDRCASPESVTPETVTTVEELDTLPNGIVVLSEAGTIACRYDRGFGVVFGDERPFSWTKLALPATVLYRPVVQEEGK